MNESMEPGRSLDAGSARQAEIVSDYLELVWSQGGTPDLSECLQWVAPARRAALLTSLLNKELQYRRARGETPTSDEYVERFPDHADAVRTAFEGHEETITHTPLREDPAQREETDEAYTDTKASGDPLHGAGKLRQPSASDTRYRILREHARVDSVKSM